MRCQATACVSVYARVADKKAAIGYTYDDSNNSNAAAADASATGASSIDDDDANSDDDDIDLGLFHESVSFLSHSHNNFFYSAS